MEIDPQKTKQQAHELVDRLDEPQLIVLVRLIQVMLAKSNGKRNGIPIDDEEETEQEREAVAEAIAWLEANGGRGIPHDEILREFGVTEEELLDLKNPGD